MNRLFSSIIFRGPARRFIPKYADVRSRIVVVADRHKLRPVFGGMAAVKFLRVEAI